MGEDVIVSKKQANNKKAVRSEDYLKNAISNGRRSSFFDKRTFCWTTKYCVLLGHTISETEGDSIFYQKGDTRYYYRGKLQSCEVRNCKYEKYVGEKIPWKITKEINGVEHDITERSGAAPSGIPIQPSVDSQDKVDTRDKVVDESQSMGSTAGQRVGPDVPPDVPMGADIAGNNKLGEPNVDSGENKPGDQK